MEPEEALTLEGSLGGPMDQSRGEASARIQARGGRFWHCSSRVQGEIRYWDFLSLSVIRIQRL